MSTATLTSPRFNNVQIVTSSVIPESNSADSFADSETSSSGLFLQPSENVVGRSADITGFVVTGANELGKLQFTSTDGLLSLDELSDVTLTAPVAGSYLSFDGSVWENVPAPIAGASGADGEVQFASGGILSSSTDLVWTAALLTVTGTVLALTLSDGTVSVTGGVVAGVTDLSTSGVTALASAGSLGTFGVGPVIQVTPAVVASAFVANTSGIVDDTATFGGYTLGQVVAALQAYGLLA